MKKLLALLLLFGVVGCVLPPEYPSFSYVDYGNGGYITSHEDNSDEYTDRTYRVKYCSLRYSREECDKEYQYRFGYALNPETDQFYYLFDVPKTLSRKEFMRKMLMGCISAFKSECIIGGVQGNNFYYSGRDYRDRTFNMNFREKMNFAVEAIIEGIDDGSIGVDLSNNSDSSAEEIQSEIEELRREITTLIIQENLKNN